MYPCVYVGGTSIHAYIIIIILLLSSHAGITVRYPLQEYLLGRSAVSAGVAADKGEEDKDAHHDELV